MKSSVFAHEAKMVCHNLAHEVFGFCHDVSHGRRGKMARGAALALALCREAGRSCVPRRASVHTDRRFKTVMAKMYQALQEYGLKSLIHFCHNGERVVRPV